VVSLWIMWAARRQSDRTLWARVYPDPAARHASVSARLLLRNGGWPRGKHSGLLCTQDARQNLSRRRFGRLGLFGDDPRHARFSINQTKKKSPVRQSGRALNLSAVQRMLYWPSVSIVLHNPARRYGVDGCGFP
jgi:hypothetical protein